MTETTKSYTVHYWNNKLGTVTLCGELGPWDRYIDIIPEVTCTDCLKIIENAKGIPGLKNSGITILTHFKKDRSNTTPCGMKESSRNWFNSTNNIYEVTCPKCLDSDTVIKLKTEEDAKLKEIPVHYFITETSMLLCGIPLSDSIGRLYTNALHVVTCPDCKMFIERIQNG